MSRLVRNFDWASTPLGPLDDWSDTLLSHVNLVLCSPLPATLLWGEHLTFFYNDAAIPTLGNRHGRALGCSYREVFADAWHLVGPDIEDCFYRGATPIRENIYVPLVRDEHIEDGYYTYALIPVYEDGKIAGVYDPYQNTTSFVLSERDRALQAERLELALSAANGVGIWDWDVAADRVFANPEFAMIYGVDPVKAREGVSISAFSANIYYEDQRRVGDAIAEAIQFGSDFEAEYRLVQSNGSVRWVFAKGRCYHDEDGKPLRFPGVTLDVTNRVAMREALEEGAERLRRNEQRLQNFVDAVSDVVYRLNADWSVALDVEGRGILPDTRKPDPDWFLRYVHPEDQDRVHQAIEKAIREGTIFEMEHKVHRLDGTMGWVSSRAIPVRDEHGVIVEWFGGASDITARKHAEQALISTEKLAAVGRLASSIAHEINNPLEAVTNLLFLANDSADAETKVYLESAERELQRVSHITRNTLQFNRQRATPESVDVAGIMQSVLDLYSGRLKQAGIQVTFEQRDCPKLTALAGELRQMFANLVGNALDALKRGGRLTIRLRPAGFDGEGTRGIHVVIADNGHGMSARTQADMYKPFFTTKESTGTGLGLWISSGIMQRHGGRIRARSRQTAGRSGTCFTLFLPLQNVFHSPEEAAALEN